MSECCSLLQAPVTLMWVSRLITVQRMTKTVLLFYFSSVTHFKQNRLTIILCRGQVQNKTSSHFLPPNGAVDVKILRHRHWCRATFSFFFLFSCTIRIEEQRNRLWITPWVWNLDLVRLYRTRILPKRANLEKRSGSVRKFCKNSVKIQLIP